MAFPVFKTLARWLLVISCAILVFSCYEMSIFPSSRSGAATLTPRTALPAIAMDMQVFQIATNSQENITIWATDDGEWYVNEFLAYMLATDKLQVLPWVLVQMEHAAVEHSLLYIAVTANLTVDQHAFPSVTRFLNAAKMPLWSVQNVLWRPAAASKYKHPAAKSEASYWPNPRYGE